MSANRSTASSRSQAAAVLSLAQAALLGAIWRALLVVAGFAILVGALADAVEARAAQPSRVAWVRYRSLGPPPTGGPAPALCVTGDFTPCGEPPAAPAAWPVDIVHATDARPSSARPARMPCRSTPALRSDCAASSWRLWTAPIRRAL